MGTKSITQRKRKTNFTLVEITLAVFILAIGVCSILSIFPVAMKWGSEAMSSGTGSVTAISAISWLEKQANRQGSMSVNSSTGYLNNEGDTTSDGFIEDAELGDANTGGYLPYYKFDLSAPISGNSTTGYVYNLSVKVFRKTKPPALPDPANDDPVFTCQTFIYDKQ